MPFTGSESDELGLDTATIVNGVDAITNGTITFLSETVTGLDFSAVTDYDGVASVLQTALRATSETDLDQVEVVYDGSAFVLTLPLDSSTGVVPTANAAFTGDDADELGLDTATIVNGVDAIVSGTVTFLSQTVTGLDFSAVTDYDGVASVLQTGLRGTSATSLDEVEVAYDGSAFVVTLPLDSQGAATAVATAFTGDDADELGLDSATIVDGVSAIKSGGVTFLGASVTGLDFSSVEDYDGVASVLQTALRGTSSADLAEVEVAYDSTASVFVVTIPLDSSGVATSVSAAFTGSESDELGLDTVDTTPGIDGIGAGSLSWQGSTITGLDFTDATSYADVAQTLQTALRAVRAAARADLRGATVTYHPAGFFLVDFGFDPSDDEPYPITGYMVDVAQEVASDLSLDSDSGGVITQGHTSETIEEGMSAIGTLDDSWYFVAVDSQITTSADLIALSRWVQSQPHMLALDMVDEHVIAQGETTSLAAQIAVLEQERTFLVWSRTSDHKALSLAGRLSTVNFDGQNTLITAKFKSLPGTTPDNLTTAQKEELDRKRVGYYTRFGPDAIFAEGWLTNGDWIDVRYWLDWLSLTIQFEVYGLLRQHPTRVPQTDAGIASITAAVERVCEAGRRNGGIASGVVSEVLANDIRLATGNPSFDGLLTLGYLVSVDSIAGQSQANRDARIAPPISVWLKGSGAVHYVEIRLIFTN